MDYTGQTCPACGRKFDANDDIVVCPVCGTPQHRSCWEENGECVNDRLHAEGYSWQPENVGAAPGEHQRTERQTEQTRSAGKQICPVCGEENDPVALNCTNCGAPLQLASAQQFTPFFNAGEAGNPYLYGITLDPESEIDGAKVKDLACAVQSSSVRYIPKFKAMADKKKKLTFNWAAFFFSPYWLFFRKLWKEGLVFIGLMLAVNLPFTNSINTAYMGLQTFMQSPPDVSTYGELMEEWATLFGIMKPMLPVMIIMLALHIAIGFLANGLYKRSVITKVKTLRSTFPEDRAFEAATLRKGGTSIMLAFAAYIGYDIVYSLLLSLVELIIT